MLHPHRRHSARPLHAAWEWILKSFSLFWTRTTVPTAKVIGRVLVEGFEMGNVAVVDLESYGFKLLLPEHQAPDKSGWQRLVDLPVVVLDGDGKFRQFLAGCEREHGVRIKIGAECTSYPQAADLAEVAGWAVFVPEYWWRRRKEWAARTQKLPGLEQHQWTFQLGWNKKVADRRPEVAKLVKALGG